MYYKILLDNLLILFIHSIFTECALYSQVLFLSVEYNGEQTRKIPALILVRKERINKDANKYDFRE